jgi:hypothetical protein
MKFLLLLLFLLLAMSTSTVNAIVEQWLEDTDLELVDYMETGIQACIDNENTSHFKDLLYACVRGFVLTGEEDRRIDSIAVTAILTGFADELDYNPPELYYDELVAQENEEESARYFLLLKEDELESSGRDLYFMEKKSEEQNQKLSGDKNTTKKNEGKNKKKTKRKKSSKKNKLM